jgi:hypothetical protein
MSIPSLRLPDSLHNQIRELSTQDGISINRFIVSAVAEKTSALYYRKIVLKTSINSMTIPDYQLGRRVL